MAGNKDGVSKWACLHTATHMNLDTVVIKTFSRPGTRSVVMVTRRVFVIWPVKSVEQCWTFTCSKTWISSVLLWACKHAHSPSTCWVKCHTPMTKSCYLSGTAVSSPPPPTFEKTPMADFSSPERRRFPPSSVAMLLSVSARENCLRENLCLIPFWVS